MRLASYIAYKIYLDATVEMILMFIANKLLFMFYAWKNQVPHWYLGFLPMAPVILAKKYLCEIQLPVVIVYAITGILVHLEPLYFILPWLACKWYKDYQMAKVVTTTNALCYTFIPFWRYGVLFYEGYLVQFDDDETETGTEVKT